jgi:hypothetical protein
MPTKLDIYSDEDYSRSVRTKLDIYILFDICTVHCVLIEDYLW